MTSQPDRSFRSGDVQWIADNWARTRPLVTAFVRGAIGDAHAVDDIVQEVARAVVEGFDANNPPKAFAAWTMGIARHKVADYIRGKSRDKQIFVAELLDELADAHIDLHDQLDDRLDALRHCMKRLQQRAQLAIDLRYNRDLSMHDIGERLAISDRAASMLLHRTRVALLKCIEHRLEAEDHR